MSIIAKVFALFSCGTPSITRLPEEAKLDHRIRNFHSAMQGAQVAARRIAAHKMEEPKRAELRELKEQSASTIDALVREMQGRQ